MTVPEGTDGRPHYSLGQVVGVIRHLCDVAGVPERGRVLLQHALAERTALELSSALQGAGVTHQGLALGLLADLLTVHAVHSRADAARDRVRRLAPDDDYGRRCADDEHRGRQRSAALWLAWAAREGSGRAAEGLRLATLCGEHAPAERRAWARELRAALDAPDRGALDRLLAREEEAILLAAAHRRPWAEVSVALVSPPAAAPEAAPPGVEPVSLADLLARVAPVLRRKRERQALEVLVAAGDGFTPGAQAPGPRVVDTRAISALKRALAAVGWTVEDGQRTGEGKGYRLRSVPAARPGK